MEKKSKTTRIILVGILILIAALFYQFELYKYLTFDYLKAQQDNLRQLYETNQIAMIAAFFAVYVITTAMSLPGAAILTIAAGAKFGNLTGVILVSFASTIGATLAFLMARYLLHDYVQEKFGDKLEPINRGVEKDGAFYLFSLRLVPAVPFFIVNLLMGLTNIKTLTYFFVSQVGMLAGTAVYVNAGTQLSRIESASGLLSPSLLVSFVLLGILPITSKKILEFVKSKRAQEA